MSTTQPSSDPVVAAEPDAPAVTRPAAEPITGVGRMRSPRRSSATAWVLIAVVTAAFLPMAAGVLVKTLCDTSSRVVDGATGSNADGAPIAVTALAWSREPDGALLVGTAEGRVLRIDRDGSLERSVAVSDGGPIMAIEPGAALEHYDVTLDETASQGEGVYARLFPVRRVVDAEVSGVGTNTQRGLLAIGKDAAATKYIGSPPRTPTAAFTQQQQSVPVPSGLTLATWAGPGSAPQPISLGTWDDPRRVAALPGSGVVFGDGSGNVVQLQARPTESKQPAAGGLAGTLLGRQGPPASSGDGPAIVALATAATAEGGVVVASAAADHSVMVWRARAAGTGGTAPRFEPGVGLTAYRPGWVWTQQPDVPAATINFVGGIFNTSGNLLFVAGVNEETQLFVRDLRSPTTVPWPVPPEPDSTRSIFEIANNGTVLAGRDTRPDLYAAGGLPIGTLATGSRSVARAAAFDPAARVVAVGFANGSIETFDASTASLLRPATTVGASVLKIVFSPDGTLLAAALGNGGLATVEVSTGRVYVFRDVAIKSLQGLGFSADGLQLFVADAADRTLRRFSTRSGRQLGSLVSPPDWLGGLSRDGGLLIRSATSRTAPAGDIEVMDAVTGIVADLITANATDILSTPFVSDDGRRIALFEDGGLVRSWLRQAGPEQATAMPAIADGGLRLSADGSTLLVRTPSGALHVARLTGADAGRLRAVAMAVAALQAELTPDGSTIVAGCADGSIRLVSIGTSGAAGGTLVLSGHGAPVDHLALSPDGLLAATASGDGRVRITDLSRAAWIDRLPLATLPSDPPIPRMAPQFFAPQARPGARGATAN